MTFIMWARGKI